NVRIPGFMPPAPSATAGGELSELSGDELREVLESVAQLGGEQQAVSAQDVGLDELSASQLRALLESLGGGGVNRGDLYSRRRHPGPWRGTGRHGRRPGRGAPRGPGNGAARSDAAERTTAHRR